jgi:hypothetical protein
MHCSLGGTPVIMQSCNATPILTNVDYHDKHAKMPMRKVWGVLRVASRLPGNDLDTRKPFGAWYATGTGHGSNGCSGRTWLRRPNASRMHAARRAGSGE